MELDLTQRDVADRLGVNQGDMSAAERGKGWHDIAHLQRWAKALDMSFQMTLVGSDGDRVTTTDLDEIRMALLGRRLALNINQRQLAEQMGVSQSVVCYAETARVWNTVRHLQRWAEALGMQFEVVVV